MLKFTLIFIVGAVVGYFVGRKSFGGVQDKAGAGNLGGLSELNTQRQEEAERNKSVIMESFGTRESVTNDDVQQMLGVSDSTATRYLQELVKEGKLSEVGEGSGIKYTVIK